MKTPKLDVICKFSFVTVGIIFLALVLATGVGLLAGADFIWVRHLHFTSAFILFILICFHIINRKRKLAKIKTQFFDLLLRNKRPSFCNLDRLIASVEQQSISQICQKFQLDENQFLQTLNQARIKIPNNQWPLRRIFPRNDEKIFSIISLALKASFNPND